MSNPDTVKVAGWRAKVPERAWELAEQAGPLVPDTPEQVRRELDDMRSQMAWERWCRMVRDRYARYSDGERALDFLGDLTPDQHPDDLRRWLASDSQTLILVGDSGRGKTHAAVDIGYDAASRGIHTTITSQLDYLAKLRPGGSDDPGRVRFRMETTELAIIDDMGAETEDGTEFIRREMCALLDARISSRRRMVITTNNTPDELTRSFGKRIISRLRDDSFAVRFEGPDWRKARKAEDPW